MSRGKVSIPLDLPCPDALVAGQLGKQQAAYQALREAILERRLAAGARLPSTRVLAERWGVSRGTLERVFERLCSEGYVSRVGGSGTRVCAVIPDALLGMAPREDMPITQAAEVVSATLPGVQAGVPFVARLPDPQVFPWAQWSRALTRGLATASAADLGSGDAAGLASLREQIAAYLRSYRGIACQAQEVIITSGIRHGLDLLARTLLAPGDKVCVEDPGYPAARTLFGMAGAQVVDVPVGAQGIDQRVLDAHDDARLVYVTPAHQSPLGVTLSVSRRLELLAWAQASGAWVIEDDYDSEFNYHSAPLPALKALDGGERVIYCGSFNKTLFVGLRVGFMLVPAAVRGPLLERLGVTARSVGITEQVGLAEYLGNGGFVRHLRQARQAYQARRDVLLACLAEGAPGCYEVSGQQAGLHFVLWLGVGVEEQAFCQRAAQVGLIVQPLGRFCRQVHLPAGVMIGFAALSLAQVRYSGRQLARVLREMCGGVLAGGGLHIDSKAGIQG